MIVVGKRQSGKTHYLVNEIIKKRKIGESVLIVSYNYERGNNLKKSILLEYRKLYPNNIKELLDFEKNIRISSSFESRFLFNYILIDDLDMILGENCICTISDVIKIQEAK